MAAGFLWLIYTAIAGVGAYFRSLSSDVAKALVAGVAAVVASAITIVVAKAFESHAATVKELRAKKAPVYEEIVNGAFKMLFAKMLEMPPPDEQAVKEYLVKSTEALTIWGSNGVVSAFAQFKTGAGNDPSRSLFLFEDLLFAIRKDLGHAGTLPRASLLRIFVTDIDEYVMKVKAQKPSGTGGTP